VVPNQAYIKQTTCVLEASTSNSLPMYQVTRNLLSTHLALTGCHCNTCSYIPSAIRLTGCERCVYSSDLVATGCHCSKRLTTTFDATTVLTGCH